MVQKVINVGTPNAGDGDPLRDAMVKVNQNFTELYGLLAGALYEAPTVDLLLTTSAGGTTVEIGTTVTSVTLNWTLGGATATSQTASDGSTNNTVAIGTTTYTYTGSITSNKTYSISVSDGQSTVSDSTTLTFSHKRYWGASASTNLTDTQIRALSSEFASSKGKSIIYDCSGGKYPYYCYPAAWGAPSLVTVSGLAYSGYVYVDISGNTSSSPTARAFTNASGNTTNFYLIRFNGIQTGAAISVVWS